jgi:hypothetical protein
LPPPKPVFPRYVEAEEKGYPRLAGARLRREPGIQKRCRVCIWIPGSLAVRERPGMTYENVMVPL